MATTTHQPVDLVFRDISYEAFRWTATGIPEKRRILHGMSGEFCGGRLSAIMGPSGAGKSTLLKILAGYTCRGVSGDIVVEGGATTSTSTGLNCCKGATISSSADGAVRKRSCLIRQEDHLRDSLTVLESMGYAAQLKMGGRMKSPCCNLPGSTPKERDAEVTRILEMLGLQDCSTVRSGRLSGGQRKRMSMALELIDDPPIMFLDEPTTGLDSSSCTHCVALLKRLAADGRTIVCTIHQPSALLLEMFDNLYVIADGLCTYRGSVGGLIPFLGLTADLRCPPYHNPADFVIEMLSPDESGKKIISTLSSAIQNGQYYVTDSGAMTIAPMGLSGQEKQAIKAGDTPEKLPNSDGDAKVVETRGETSKETLHSCDQCDSFRMASSSFEQFCILSRRNFLMMRRNYSQLGLRLMAHLTIGIIFGYLYQNVGTDGGTVLGNYMYVYGSLLFLVYTGKMAVLLNFPLEMEVLSQEHFNRWYSLVPYCFSTIMTDMPFQAVACLMYLIISYLLTGQPLNSYCILLFFLSNILASLAAQSCGYLVGATTPIKMAVFIGPVIAVLLSMFGFCITMRDTPEPFKWLFHISYFRYALHTNMYVLYGKDRGTLPCTTKFYCHYRYPTKFLAEMDVGDPEVDIVSHLSIVSTFLILVHCSTFLAIWLRLNHLR